MIRYTTTTSDKDLEKIIHLQQQNLPTAITRTEALEQGFVSIAHDLSMLKEMSTPHPHIVAKVDHDIVGYALVMLKQHKDKIPLLISFFEQINALHYKGVALATAQYFVMGQICINKDHRGQGIFSGLYMEMSRLMKRHFDFIITNIAAQNTRSLRAHEKVGFKVLKKYESEGTTWVMVILELENTD